MNPKFFICGLLLALLSIIPINLANPQALYGEMCVKDYGGHPCAKTTHEGLPTGLSCINAKCQCESRRHHIFNKELQICQSKIGGHCTNLTEHSCLKHSYCELSTGGHNGICVCNKGLSPNKGGRCVGQHGSHCTKNCHCESKFVCRDEKCSCPDSGLQHYDPLLSICQSVVDAMCGPQDICVDGAVCRSENDIGDKETGFRSCECREGYRQVGRRCVANLYFMLDQVPPE